MQITLHDEGHRKRAHAMIDAAAPLSRVTVADPKRSDEQNRKFWAMIGDVHKQRGDWFGPGMDTEDLKQVFMAALFRELRMARNADGDGYVPLVRRSSRLSVREMANLITLIEAWGANPDHLVEWSEPGEAMLTDVEDQPTLPAAEAGESAPGASGVDPDPIEWAGALTVALPDYTDAEALVERWSSSEANREALKAKYPETARTLHAAVSARIRELRG